MRDGTVAREYDVVGRDGHIQHIKRDTERAQGMQLTRVARGALGLMASRGNGYKPRASIGLE